MWPKYRMQISIFNEVIDPFWGRYYCYYCRRIITIPVVMKKSVQLDTNHIIFEDLVMYFSFCKISITEKPWGIGVSKSRRLFTLWSNLAWLPVTEVSQNPTSKRRCLRRWIPNVTSRSSMLKFFDQRAAGSTAVKRLSMREKFHSELEVCWISLLFCGVWGPFADKISNLHISMLCCIHECYAE